MRVVAVDVNGQPLPDHLLPPVGMMLEEAGKVSVARTFTGELVLAVNVYGPAHPLWRLAPATPGLAGLPREGGY